MNLFKKWSVCDQCRHAFEPYPADIAYADYRTYCPEHRNPLIEILLRRKQVLWWADHNWERLEPQMIDDNGRVAEMYSKNMAAAQNVNPSALGSGLYGPNFGK